MEKYMIELTEEVTNQKKLYLNLHRRRDRQYIIGFERNLSRRGISVDEGNLLLSNDITIAENGLYKYHPGIRRLPLARRNVAINMTFNMGIKGFNNFKDTLRSLEKGNFLETAYNMKQSMWYNQVKGRGVELVQQMREGTEVVPGHLDLFTQLKSHEGFELSPYYDSVGVLTIGAGRNLEANGVSKEEAMQFLINDIRLAEIVVRKRQPNINRSSSEYTAMIVSTMSGMV